MGGVNQNITKIDIFKKIAVVDGKIDEDLFGLISTSHFFPFIEFCNKVQQDKVELSNISCDYTKKGIEFIILE